jgi:molybdopterin-guanine dinucleotide biosynthesis protein A
MAVIDGSQKDVAGYILAGGRSTRMGQDKAMLQLAGMPLVEHAVRKLRSVASDICILSRNPNLASYAPLVPDLHEDCGPLGGIDAALANTRKQWVLIMPVDMPFVPIALLRNWMHGVLASSCVRVSLFSVDSAVQPALCMLHRDVAPYLRKSLEDSRLKLFPELKDAAQALAAETGASIDDVLVLCEWNAREAIKFSAELEGAEQGGEITAAQWAALPVWFTNLNTPDEFAMAEQYAGALDM